MTVAARKYSGSSIVSFPDQAEQYRAAMGGRSRQLRLYQISDWSSAADVASPVRALQDYYPRAKSADWELEVEGQRVQIIKPDPKRGGFLEFGTELVAAADHSLVALLGASPGADGGFHLDRRPREVLQGRIGSERLASQAQGHDPILWLVADRKRRPVPARPRRNRGRATPGICLNIDLGRRCRGPPSFGADVFR